MATKKRTGKAKNPPSKGAELRFKIDAFTPRTLPMARLAQYITELAEVLGERTYVHFLRVEEGSAAPVIWVDHEAIPKVQSRAESVRREEAPSEAIRAYRRLNMYLREDNASAALLGEDRSTILSFPGRQQAVERFGLVRQHGSLDGVVKRIGGIDQTIHITLVSEDQQISHIRTSQQTAKRLATHIFDPVRLFGLGKWRRDTEGSWTLEEFQVHDFAALDNTSLSGALDKIRAINTEWDDESYADLDELRHGPKGESNGGH
jgi:hypothetical protein